MSTEKPRPPFNQSTLQTLRNLLANQPEGNRWFKVNLHAHGQGNDPTEIIKQARLAEIDLLAITDHQSFKYCPQIIQAASTPGRPITVLPGMEITAHEGCHLLAIFPTTFNEDLQTRLLGWLSISGEGQTHQASPQHVADIFDKIEELGGITVIPHPMTDHIGMLSKSRKMSTRVDWLATGYINLMQIDVAKVRHLGHDGLGNWINRYVLSSANPHQVDDSTYCLAPFNRSDAHEAAEISTGCSWFRMSEPTVDGLKQVVCEPKTRIARVEPTESTHDCILGVRVSGGYSDGQFFKLNDGLNCFVGDNHSGKSAVLDFIRFALGDETLLVPEDRQRLLNRMNGILLDGGIVEVFLRQDKNHFVVRRQFKPVFTTKGKTQILEGCSEQKNVLFHHITDGLIPSQDFRFPLEVYEQGRVSRLREDVDRQLEMLDEFAELTDQKRRRDNVVESMNASAAKLKPLYEESELLKSKIASLTQLTEELAQKEILLPKTDDEQAWTNARATANGIESILKQLLTAQESLASEPSISRPSGTELAVLFGHTTPAFDADHAAQSDTLTSWVNHLSTALEKIEAARQSVLVAVREFDDASKPLRAAFKVATEERAKAIREKLATAGIDSPVERVRPVECIWKAA